MEITRKHILLLPIENESDIGVCRRKSASLARHLGFDELKSGEVAITVTELATNVLKHGGGKGEILICQLLKNKQKAIEIWCCDMGNGISNPNQAIADGYTDKSSLGIGLGSIRRFSDELEINPAPEQLAGDSVFVNLQKYTSCIRSVKWLPAKQWFGHNRHLIIGAASRCKPGESLNGDTYVISHINPEKTVVAIIDGLGHGKEAHIAAQLAREQIILKAEFPVKTIIESVHQRIRGTRGCVIGLAFFDATANKLFYAGIGNIEGFVFSSGTKKNLLSFGGIVGHNMRTPRVLDFEFGKEDYLCLYTDGITSRWRSEHINWNEHPQKNAEHLLNNYSRQNDDATVLIVRYHS